jgi:MoaA/NifB/PqqE/SkfB family radical SAM enzyme
LKEQKQKKNIKHLSQLEYAIYQKIKKNNMVSFFPVGRARVLEKDEESDSDSQREHELLNRLEKLERKMNQLTTETRKQSTESYLAAIYEYIRITSQHNTNQSSTPVNSKY